MWQIICLCLPAVTPSERQRFFTLFRNALHASGREADEMDLSLFFLHTLSSQEALTVLEERLHLVVRSQELMGQQRTMESGRDISQWVIDDHLRTLLAADMRGSSAPLYGYRHSALYNKHHHLSYPEFS